LDDAAAQYAIISIEHRGLPWTQGALWLMEDNAEGAI
jgi:hypothetical protein